MAATKVNKKEYKQQWYLKNRERLLAKANARYEMNRIELKKKRLDRYYSDIEKGRAQLRADYKKNRRAYIERAAYREKMLLKRIPKWLTVEQRKMIKDFWLNCPKGYHVDHIVPLQGKNVSGLHVPWNLQYLPAYKNLSKSNKHESD